MRKRFVVILTAVTEQQSTAFFEYIKTRPANVGWWHWVDNVWLLYSDEQGVSCVTIREKLNELFPGVSKLVLEMQPNGRDFWAGFGPNTKERNMFEWLEKNWHS